VRSWEGTWASDALQTPEFAAFQVPYEDAEGGVKKRTEAPAEAVGRMKRAHARPGARGPRAFTSQRGFAAIPVSAAAAAAPCRCASGIHANKCRLKGPQASTSVHTRPGQHRFLVSPV
jgi:hypothetical protein